MKIEQLKKFLSKDVTQAIKEKEAKALGKLVVLEMKNLIAKGTSPITGKRFPAYKNPKKYPASVKDKYPAKGARPVNLYLSGDMLGDLVGEPEKGKFTYATEFKYSSEESEKKELGHRNGKFGQPERPTIPDAARGERFTQKLTQKIIDFYLNAVDKYVKETISKLSK